MNSPATLTMTTRHGMATTATISTMSTTVLFSKESMQVISTGDVLITSGSNTNGTAGDMKDGDMPIAGTKIAGIPNMDTKAVDTKITVDTMAEGTMNTEGIAADKEISR